MTPVHHQNPQHTAFFLPPTNLENLDDADTRHYLDLAIEHISYQTQKIDSLETQLLCCAQYINVAHRKLYQKEHKKEKSKLEKLAAGGKRLLTSDAWEKALEDETNQKQAKEALITGYQEWKETEKRERKVQDDERVMEWMTYRNDFLAKNPRRKRCDKLKPPPLKRAETPQKYWPIRPKRAGALEGRDEVVESEGSDEEEN